MSIQVRAVTVSDPSVGTRDGLEFTATANGIIRRCFISGSALAVLRSDFEGSAPEAFIARKLEIGWLISKKLDSDYESEVVICSEDIKPVP